MNLLKKFWMEEDGITTIELLLILAVLIVIALLFKNTIVNWVKQVLNTIFPDPSTLTE